MSDLTRLNVMIPKDLKQKLEAIAEDKGLNLSSLVRLILTAESKKQLFCCKRKKSYKLGGAVRLISVWFSVSVIGSVYTFSDLNYTVIITQEQ